MLDISNPKGTSVTVESEKEKSEVANNKRKAEGSPDRRIQKTQKMATMEEKMDLLLARTAAMVTPEDVEKIATKVEDRLKAVEKNQDTFMEKQESMDARLSRLREEERGLPGVPQKMKERSHRRTMDWVAAFYPGNLMRKHTN